MEDIFRFIEIHGEYALEMHLKSYKHLAHADRVIRQETNCEKPGQSCKDGEKERKRERKGESGEEEEEKEERGERGEKDDGEVVGEEKQGGGEREGNEEGGDKHTF